MMKIVRYYHESKAGGGAVVEEGLPLLEVKFDWREVLYPYTEELIKLGWDFEFISMHITAGDQGILCSVNLIFISKYKLTFDI